jgi:RND superfamily putative drug exporter
MVLVPAVMELLGKANWWLPAPLARILPKSSVPEDELPADVGIPVPADPIAG